MCIQTHFFANTLLHAHSFNCSATEIKSRSTSINGEKYLNDESCYSVVYVFTTFDSNEMK